MFDWEGGFRLAPELEAEEAQELFVCMNNMGADCGHEAGSSMIGQPYSRL